MTPEMSPAATGARTAAEAHGARPCCGEYAIVTDCDGTTDRLYCGICGRRWSQPCADADLLTPRPA